MRVGFLLFNSDGSQDYLGGVDTAFHDFNYIRKVASDNTGNLMFKFATRKLFEDDVVYVRYSDDPSEVRSKIDVLVLPEANLINPQVNYGAAANFVANVDKPTLLFGVGAQGSMHSSPEDFLNIPEGSKRFLLEVSKRTPAIFCRGSFTKKVIELLGIKNVRAIGCPTFMIYPKSNLWRKIGARSKFSILDRASITEGVYPQVNRTQSLDFTERFLFDLVLSENADYVGQAQVSVLKSGFGLFDEVNKNDLFNLKKYIAPQLSDERFEKISTRNFKAFCRVDNWLNYAASRTAFCGSRIHGNMVGIQSGTPSLPLVHDSRTNELCQSMRLPHLNMNDFFNIRTKQDFIDAFDIVFNSDLLELDQFRASVANLYAEILLEVGLTPSRNLLAISQE